MVDTFYPIKHWLVTLLIGPVTTGLLGYLFYREGLGLLEVFPILVFWGMILSLPSLLVYYLLFTIWIKKLNSALKQKLLLNGIAILCTTASFMLLTVFERSVLLSFMTGYIAAVLLASLFIKIREPGSTDNGY